MGEGGEGEGAGEGRYVYRNFVRRNLYPQGAGRLLLIPKQSFFCYGKSTGYGKNEAVITSLTSRVTNHFL